MRIVLLATGRLRPALREVADDYLRRLGRHLTLEEREAREASRAPTPDARRAEEDQRLLRMVPEGTPITLLDRQGTAWTSEMLARRLDRWRLEARDRALVIGGAEGVGPTLRDRADESWSLGPLTLPHELARIIVLEQLYRADAILRGTPYHRGDR